MAANRPLVPETPTEGDRSQFRYELNLIKGEGGLGRVWLARDTSLGRRVAFKELKPEKAVDPKARRRFIQEARVTGQLEHPNIIPVYELGWRPDDGLPYYTMPFLCGRTLGDAIAEYTKRRGTADRSRIEMRRLLSVFVSVCNAVGYAHSRWIVHRDLKPENVVLGTFGETILLDWGIAKYVRRGHPEGESPPPDEPSDTLAKQTGTVEGTPGYMAPEQAAGRSDLVNERTDVYGLGAILFEMLTGRPPHGEGSALEILVRTLEDPTPAPRSLDPSVPSPLDAICRKAMAASPAARYGTATEIAEDVDRWLADEPVSAYREPLRTRVARWVRRHQTWVMAATTALVAAMLVVSMAALKLRQMADRERELRRQGMYTSARFAARTVASEIDLRWRILETAAASEELREMLAALNGVEQGASVARHRAHGRPVVCTEWMARFRGSHWPTETLSQHPSQIRLQEWVQDQSNKHFDSTKAKSWFVTTRVGTQVARHPYSERSFGKCYAFRDYFHGKGSYLPACEAADAQDLLPILEPHRSSVFVSDATDNPMVAFSVPVWARAADRKQEEVIGVLAMTVEVGQFGELQLGLGDRQIVVLVDTRGDNTGRCGFILHHPHLAGIRANQGSGSRIPSYYLEPSVVEQMTQLRNGARDWEGKVGSLDERVLDGYHDRIDPGCGENLLAVFEPILVKGRPDSIRDTGWVVIVQEVATAGR